nr:glycosyltransferase [uncultured Draconibacterium sp.]
MNKLYDSKNAIPLVSVLCQTYNHEFFIRECLEGILKQETNFPFEVLVHDDASTDGTAEIIREYEKKCSRIINPIYQTENQYSQKKGVLSRIQIPRARGKYIAICEGDDYWTDPNKLQKQFNFLEKNSMFSMCCTNYSEVDEKGNTITEKGWSKKLQNPIISHLTIIEKYKPKMLTAFINKSCLPNKYPECSKRAPNGDNFLFALVTESGPAAYLDFVSGAYRLNQGGIWAKQSIEKQKEMQLKTCNAMKEYFKKPEEIKAINARIARIKLILAIHSLKKKNIFGGIKLIVESVRVSRKPLLSPFIELMNLKN